MIGFETIGNATLIVHDDKPLLATDPWFEGPAYFGSWGLSHEIPNTQRDHIARCPYVWISHGHPDHLSGPCLEQLKSATILLSDHVGGRIATELAADGFNIRVLKDAEWVSISERVKIMSLADFNQDAALLVDVDGHLLINLNDSSHEAFFWKRKLKNLIKHYKQSFLFKIAGYGDANMINYWDEFERQIVPRIKDIQVGKKIRFYTDYYQPTFFVPFSSFHVYQREDSAWANDYLTPLSAYRDGWGDGPTEMLPAFIRWDSRADDIEVIDAKPCKAIVHKPEEFGDRWSDVLEAEDKTLIETYFKRITALGRRLDFVKLRVGGEEFTVDLGKDNRGRGVTFELPRQSLLTAVEHCVFDDLMIGNFTKTTLHGDWGSGSLYPHFMPLVPKYADNGLAMSRGELQQYFESYRRRAPLEYLLHNLETSSQSRLRPWLARHPRLFNTAIKSYQFVRRF